MNGKIALVTAFILLSVAPDVAQSGASITTSGPNITMQQNLNVTGTVAAGTTTSGSVNGVLNPTQCGSSPVPSWCSGSALAAWIDAADTALGSNPGEIWIPAGSWTATDAQISIGPGHSLRVIGNLTIDAVNKGPILLAQYANLDCSALGGSNSVGNIVQVSPGTMTSMVRGASITGSQEAFYVENCDLWANQSNVSRGIVDVSGLNDRGRISHDYIAGNISGAGIYSDDSASGFVGSSYFTIEDNWLQPYNSGTCINFQHSSNPSNGPVALGIRLINNECQPSNTSSATQPLVRFNNDSANPDFIYDLDIDGMKILGIPAGGAGAAGTGLWLSGVYLGSFNDITCQGGTSANPGKCVYLNSGGDDIFRNIRVQYPGSLSYLTTLYDTTNLGYCGGACTVTDAVIPHYEVSARNQYSAGSIYAANFYGALNTPSGTFAPSLQFGGASTGMTGTFSGFYRTVGSLVYVQISIQLTALGTATGAATIAGLPYTAGGISASNQGCAIGYMGAMAGINAPFLANIPQGSNAIGLFLMGTAWDSPMTNSNFTSSSNIQLSCVYSE